MSRSADKSPTQPRHTKAELEERIYQQRLELMYHSARLRRSAVPIDQGLQRVWQWRIPLIATAGIALIPVLRRPGNVVRLGRKAFFSAITLNRARRLLR